MIEEIITYIADNTSLTLGTDLKLFAEEGDADTCTYLTEHPGGDINFYQTDHRSIAVEVNCRSFEFHTARDTVLEIVALLNGQSGIVLPTVTSGQVYLLQTCKVFTPPTYEGVDRAGKHRYYAILLIRIQDNPD